MANMFSGKTSKQIPATLNECTREDATVNNLHIWATRLETLGKILFWILIVVGVAFALVESIQTIEVVKGTYYQYTETKTTFNFELFLTSIAQTALYAFIEYCSFHVLALLISALATITQNTIISANVALYQAAKDSESNQELNQTAAPAGMWICKDCGAHNSLNYGQCKKCGKYRA